MSLTHETRLRTARQRAEAGAWRDVAEVLMPCAASGALAGEDALLYAEALVRSGEQRSALTFLRESLAEGEGAAAPRVRRRAANMTGVAAFALGELDEAEQALNVALDLATRDDDPRLLAQATNNLGAIANLHGRYEDALWHYRLALPTLQRIGQPQMLAEAYHNLAITYRDLGELEESDEHELRAIEHATDGGVPRLAAMGRVGRAEVALRRGDAAFAETTARKAGDEFARLGDPQNEADALRLVGACCTAQRHYDDALAAFDRALEIARERGHALNEAETLRDRAELHLAQGRVALALVDARNAIAIFDRLGAIRERDALRSRVRDRESG